MKQVNLRIYQTILTLLVGLFLSAGAYAQQISVRGIVKDQMGEPVIGANVLVKGTSNGVITDIDGKFALSAAKNDILIISFVGFMSQEIPVTGKDFERRYRTSGRGGCFGIWRECPETRLVSGCGCIE
mgnify:CR=1 FL=1